LIIDSLWVTPAAKPPESPLLPVGTASTERPDDNKPTSCQPMEKYIYLLIEGVRSHCSCDMVLVTEAQRGKPETLPLRAPDCLFRHRALEHIGAFAMGWCVFVTWTNRFSGWYIGYRIIEASGMVSEGGVSSAAQVQQVSHGAASLIWVHVQVRFNVPRSQPPRLECF
jgi:hypothetical protein